MRDLAARVLDTIRKRELIKAGDRVAVAVSGGADSVALLLLLLELRPELGIVLAVAHVNHKLRGAESEDDERFVAELAGVHELELMVKSAPVTGKGIEAAARKLRYEFFRDLAQAGKAAIIATGHTLDDQAETVLLRVFRGTGIRGLAGIYPRLSLEHDRRTCGAVVRPLLGQRRAEIREFLRERGQAWREDSSNNDPAFLRNKVRMGLLPVLQETFGDSALENLADLAEIARAEDEQWAVAGGPWSAPSLDLRELRLLALAAQRRAIRAWIENTAPEVKVSFRAIEDVLDLARSSAGHRLELSGGRAIRVAQGELRWESAAGTTDYDYEYELPVPGTVELPSCGIRIQTVVTSGDGVPETERARLLDPKKLRGKLHIRNWRPGDRFWPAHTRAAKKVKELLSDRHAVGAEKKLWPVAEAGGEIVWMRGFNTPEALRPAAGAREVLWIRELFAAPKNQNSS